MRIPMKWIGCLAAVGLAGGAGTARAGDEGWAAFGGFVGGVLVNEALHHGHHRAHGHRHGGGSRVVYGGHGHHGGHYGGRVEYGHYETRETKVWVPPRTIEKRLPCGRIERRTEPGYYRIERERVWVSEPRSSGRRCR